MHGRQKVPQSAEESAKKQVERQKKLVAYKDAMTKIFAKRRSDRFDPLVMEISARVLQSNPDIHTLWNIRRESLLKLRQENPDKFNEMVRPELDITNAGLLQNPKCYGAWQQRRWLMKESDFEYVDDEMNTCNKYLKHDDRNFHCWDYRRFLVENNPRISAEKEIDFTTEMIKSNFSNYSSWHLRSKLLPRLTYDRLLEELELIQNAAFTDPNDQSVWFYHKWLVNAHLQYATPQLNFYGHEDGHVYLIFNVDVSNPTSQKMLVTANRKTEDQTDGFLWTNPWNKPRCKLWRAKLAPDVTEDSLEKFSITLGDNITCTSTEHNKDFITFGWKERITCGEDTKEFSLFLQNELQWVQDLHELEPINKWGILTLIHLLRLVDSFKNEDRILKLIERLQELDNKRVMYYADLRKNIAKELALLKQLELPHSVCSHILPPF